MTANNEVVKGGVASILYSPRIREGRVSETRIAPVLMAQARTAVSFSNFPIFGDDLSPLQALRHRTGEEPYPPSFREPSFSETSRCKLHGAGASSSACSPPGAARRLCPLDIDTPVAAMCSKQWRLATPRLSENFRDGSWLLSVAAGNSHSTCGCAGVWNVPEFTTAAPLLNASTMSSHSIARKCGRNRSRRPR
jgi:hypothetical protein